LIRNYKNIVVLGAGESGVGAALLAKHYDYKVFVSDFGEIAENYKSELVNHQIEFEENKHSLEKIFQADLIIKSPGVPEKAAIIAAAREKSITIISEIEFASWFTNAKIISITGSNGKTTTTSLIYHILKNAGFRVGLGGNIGFSFARLALNNDLEYIVLEISSFQLDDIKDFKSHIAILLNITPDHLDRYQYKIENYARSKMKIAENQTNDDYFIYNTDDELITSLLPEVSVKGRKIPFSHKIILDHGSWIENNMIKIYLNQHLKVNIDMNILTLIGTHNRYNTMAASAAALSVGVKDEDLRNALSSFQNIEHRLEFVAKIQGKEFINDSKATNVNSVWYALESMVKPVIWIAGGIDKGNNYEELLPLVKEKVKAIVCLGVDNSKINDFFSPYVEFIFDTASMNEAVEISYKIAQPGDVVLLSPACASFDLFKNYEDRGIQFKEAVRNL